MYGGSSYSSLPYSSVPFNNAIGSIVTVTCNEGAKSGDSQSLTATVVTICNEGVKSGNSEKSLFLLVDTVKFYIKSPVFCQFSLGDND